MDNVYSGAASCYFNFCKHRTFSNIYQTFEINEVTMKITYNSLYLTHLFAMI